MATPNAASNNAAEQPATGAADSTAELEPPNVAPPAALDATTANTGPDLAAASLEPEIKSADTPALAASLRITEQARLELGTGKIDDAIRTLARAVSIDPGNPFEYFYLGRAYMAKANYPQALIFFKRAEIGFGARPDWLGETISFEGACNEELGHMTDAAKAYKRALAAAPGNLMARVGYGRLVGNLPVSGSLDAPAPVSDSAGPPPSVSAIAPPPEAGPPLPAPTPAGPGADWQEQTTSPAAN
jgi:tetratricopeptide (TPR) repeat protein